MLSVEIAICTYGPEGGERVAAMLMPPAEGVGYVVAWQAHGDVPPPEALRRDDVRVVRTDTIGLSINRNIALDHCSADVVIIADDDLRYHVEAVERLRGLYEERPEADLIMFCSERSDVKRYPAGSVRLGRRLPKGYYATSFEMSLRRATAGGLRFRPDMGINAPLLQCGEEEVFLHEAIGKGLNCRFEPLTVCVHRHESTGQRRPTPGVLRGVGATIAIMYPATAPLRIYLKAWRLHRAHSLPFLPALRDLIAGARLA